MKTDSLTCPEEAHIFLDAVASACCFVAPRSLGRSRAGSGWRGCGLGLCKLSRDRNPLVANPLATGGKELAESKRVGFVRKQNVPHVAP